MTDVAIVPASAAEVIPVADLIAQAFQELKATAWLVPDPQQRAAIMTGDFAILVEHALTYGVIDTARTRDGLVGAAVWLDYTRKVPAPADYDGRLAAACKPYTDRFRHLDDLFDAHHPARPHHHLVLLAVHQRWQRRGIGSVLLEHHHTTLDRYAIGGYLEASSQASRDLYRRHRYHLLDDPFALPNGARFWPMWRPPAGHTAGVDGERAGR